MKDVTPQSFDIVHVTSAHPVGDTRIFVKEARSLANAGYRVAVLGPGKEVGQQADDSGVVQYTLPGPRSRAERFGGFGAKLLQAALDLNPRVVHLHDPDLLRFRARFQAAGVRVIYDMHEDFPKAMLSRSWLGPMMIRRAVSWYITRQEDKALRQVDGIVLADHQLARRLPAQAPPNVVVRNYLQAGEWPVVEPKTAGEVVRCVYVGDITTSRGALRMCDVLEACRDNGVKITLDLIGPCPDALKDQVMARPVAEHIKMHGRLGRAEVADILSQSDIGFCLFEPTPAYREGLPVKLFEYLVSGLTVVGTKLPRMQGETALSEGMFLIDWAAEADEITTAMQAARNVSAATRLGLQQRVRAHYNWTSEAQALLKLYDEIAPL